jgi:addiction module RelE/StbE family toxin
MQILFGKKFEKRAKKLPAKVKQHIEERIIMFSVNPHHMLLNNHELKGDMSPRRSINITGDIRAIYEQVNADTVRFIDIGTHSELYKK